MLLNNENGVNNSKKAISIDSTAMLLCIIIYEGKS